MKLSVLSASVCILISSFSAFAAETQLTIEVPKSEVAAASLTSISSNTSKLELEFASSTWAPQNFEGFQSAGLPYLSVSGVREFYRQDADSLSVKVGGAFYQLGRTASVDFGGGPTQIEQRDYLISARVGLEYSHTLSETFAPYLSAALIPTYSAIPRTAAADSRSEIGVPLEACFGIMTDLRSLGLNRMKLNVGGILTSGSIGTNAFSGVGALAGLRFSI